MSILLLPSRLFFPFAREPAPCCAIFAVEAGHPAIHAAAGDARCPSRSLMAFRPPDRSKRSSARSRRPQFRQGPQPAAGNKLTTSSNRTGPSVAKNLLVLRNPILLLFLESPDVLWRDPGPCARVSVGPHLPSGAPPVFPPRDHERAMVPFPGPGN